MSVVAKQRGARLLQADVENDPNVKAAVASRLPSNYEFEVPKTIWRIRSLKAKRVALQFPEGFLVFATAIADLIEQFTGADVIILGDVVYGACCVDDFTARALGCDLLVHYGHSCLVTIDRTRAATPSIKGDSGPELKAKSVEFLYVFVTIKIDINDLVERIRYAFDPTDHLALCGTIQFGSALPIVKQTLETEHGYQHISIPQCGPLSRGEVLGCTAPRLGEGEVLIFVADGRFHIEAVMLANPQADAFRYDPFARALVRERYDFDEMSTLRLAAIDRAVAIVSDVKQAAELEVKAANDTEAHSDVPPDSTKAPVGKGRFGIVLSTLGRQGAPHVLRYIEQKVRAAGCEALLVLLSEIFPEKLRLFSDVHCWVQVACPRLSIDWGAAFNPPLLNSYELSVALNEIEWKSDAYPMDFYANESSGPWTVNHETHRAAFASNTARKPRRTVRVAVEIQSEGCGANASCMTCGSCPSRTAESSDCQSSACACSSKVLAPNTVN